MYCIYQYKNKINGHMYIGFTNNLSRRDKDHWSAASNSNNKDYDNTFHRALRKYGKDGFYLEIIDCNIETLEEAKQKEQFWIAHYNTYENREHYNETPGGDAPGQNTVHFGEEHGMAVLSEEDVVFCRNSYKNGARSRDIYNTYFLDKISYGGFLRMWHGKTWKHILPEVFINNPHRAKYGEVDRDIITALYKESNKSLSAFSKTKECYVGYGTLWKMINNPEFYDNK